MPVSQFQVKVAAGTAALFEAQEVGECLLAEPSIHGRDDHMARHSWHVCDQLRNMERAVITATANRVVLEESRHGHSRCGSNLLVALTLLRSYALYALAPLGQPSHTTGRVRSPAR